MTRKQFRLNRRAFLKGAASVAGVSLVGTMGCDGEEDDAIGSGEDTDSSTDDDLGSDSGSDPVDEGDSDSETASDTQVLGREGTALFSPAKIGNVELKNRVIRSATEEAYTKMGLPSPRYIKVFTDLAAGGVGAIISGIAIVAKEDAMPFELYAFNDSQIEGFKKVRDAVREADADCKLFAQVGHTGYRYFGGQRIGPSEGGWPGDQFPTKAMETSEIDRVVEEFAQTIRRFKEGEWDGVELHAGHGYLLPSFLSPYTNKRTDEYGGSVAGRVQILKDIIVRSRELVGDDFPIFLKFNSDDRGGTEPDDLEGGIDQSTFVETANEIAKMGYDAIDVSGMNCSQTGSYDLEGQSYFKDAAVALDLDIPIMLTGGNRTPDELNDILDTGEVDFIGVSRPLIREPDLCNKWRSGETDGTECISCNICTKMLNLISGMRCHQK